MRITKLSLKNFGGHKSIEVNTDHTMMGIIGKNGKGKSTIIKAIEFAFTGSLPDKMDSYIKMGEKSTSIELEFTIGGKCGKITRKITPTTSSRSLIWDGEPPITRANEFDEAIETILGIDKQSLSNTAFTNQGDLYALLGAEPAKRMDLFSKILNLNYLSKRHDTVQTYYEKTKNSVVDTSLLKNELQEARLKYETDKRVVEEKSKNVKSLYGGFPDIDAFAQACSDYIKISQDIDTVSAIIQSKQLELENSKRVLENLENSFEEETAQEFEYKIVELTTTINKHRGDVLKLNQMLKDIDVAKEYAVSAEWYNTVKASVFKNKTATEWLDIINKINTNQTILRDWEEATKSKEECDVKLQDAKKNLQTYKDKIDTSTWKEDVEKWENDYTLTDKMYMQLELLKNTKLKLKGRVKQDTATCPQCGLKLMLGQEICDGDITELESMLNDIGNKLTDLRSKIDASMLDKMKTEEQLSKYTLEVQKYSQLSFEYDLKSNQKLEQLQKLNPNKSIENIRDELSVDLSEVRNNLIKFTAISESITSYNDFITQVNFGIKSWDELKELDVTSPQVKPEIQLLIRTHTDEAEANQKAIDARRQLLSDYKSQSVIVNNLETSITQQTNHLTSLQDNIDNNGYKTFVMECTTFFRNKESIDDNLKAVQQNLHSPRVLMGILYNNIKPIFADLESQRRLLEDVKNDIAKKEYTIKSIESENAKKYTQLRDLETIKTLLNNREGGIPKMYLEYLFRSLIPYVSDYLGELTSEFIIDYDESVNNLSFKFMKVNEPGVWLPMSKLSGGQKVTLSIAFLMSVQKIICPDLGFLVLDEPSTHLDINSVEALSELVERINTSKTLFNKSDGQIWIIDHHERLQQSMQESCITL